MKLSCCIITLNEESCIDEALSCIEDYVDELIVVDGGSVDKTVSIAEKHPLAQVHSIPWPDDFSLQKNKSIELASGDWILSLDADETLRPYEAAALRVAVEAADAEGVDALWLLRQNIVDGKLTKPIRPDTQYRLFKSYCRWKGSVHEGLEGYNNAKQCAMTLFHYRDNDLRSRSHRRYQHLVGR